LGDSRARLAASVPGRAASEASEAPHGEQGPPVFGQGQELPGGDQVAGEAPTSLARQLATLVAKRLVAAVVILFAVSFAIFTLLYIAPGSPEQTLIGLRPATPQLIAHVRAEFHLDDPFLVQYWEYLKGVLSGGFGTSVRTGAPVGEMVTAALPASLFLGVYAFVLTILFGVVAGIVAALRHRSALDRGIVGLSVIGVSTPAFASGFLLMFVFSIQLGWLPTIGAGEGFSDRLSHLTLPAIALAISGGALVVKLTRAAMVNALDQDFVTFARARGLSQRRVVVGYALRNALVPVVSGGGLILAYVLTGAVLVEVTFIIPGLGNLLIESVAAKDVPTVQAVALLFAGVIVLVNLLVDILFVLIDPRIRLGGQRG
jgi:peptide/nickel transport system permease protein